MAMFPLSSSAQPEGGRLDRTIFSLAYSSVFFNQYFLGKA
jgi:hypothetical protein